jgi:hypothetical protein
MYVDAMDRARKLVVPAVPADPDPMVTIIAATPEALRHPDELPLLVLKNNDDGKW